MTVLAKNKITGLIAPVSQGMIDANDNLVVATEKDIADAKREREILVFGEPTGGVVPETLTNPKPDMSWSKADIIAYLENKKISVDESMTKAELLATLTDEGETDGE